MTLKLHAADRQVAAGFALVAFIAQAGKTAPQVGLEKSTPRGWMWQVEKSTNNMQVKILYALLGLCYISHGGG